MRKLRFSLGLCLVMMTILTLTFSFAFASPNRQGGDYMPSPTPYPVGAAKYEMSVVGGEDITEVFERGVYGNFDVYETHVTSFYPRGMEFSVTAESSAGAISLVRLSVAFHGASKTRFEATQSADGVWVAFPWENGDGQPVWSTFDFSWIITDETGDQIETDPITVSYWDPEEAWTRFEFETFIVYIHNFERAYSAEEFAERLYTAVASTEPRRMESFGGSLSYKPTAILYASAEELAEMYGSGVRNETSGGFTNDQWGVTVQFFNGDAEGTVLRTGESTSAAWGNCMWIDPEFNPEYTFDNGRPVVQVSLDFAIYQSIAHEIAHLYQFEYNVTGPQWWTEGQAQYLTYSTMNVVLADRRLRYLATLDPSLPSLEGNNISRNMAMEDGCLYMVYHVGQSFINWFAGTYGIAAFAEVNRMNGQESGVSIFEAMEAVTGEDFLAIENGWRTYIGFTPLNLADVDPASALEEAVDPLYAEGASVTLGATPIQNPIYEVPGENKIANGSCFANTKVTILRVGSLNGLNYYEVDCQGQKGWMKESQLPLP